MLFVSDQAVKRLASSPDGIGMVFCWIDADNFYFFLTSVRHGYQMFGKKVAGNFAFLQQGGLREDLGFELNTRQQLRDQLVAIDSKLQSVTADISRIQSDLSSLRTDMVRIDSGISAINTDISRINTDMTELSTRVGKINTDVGRLNTDVLTVNGRVDGEFVSHEFAVTLTKLGKIKIKGFADDRAVSKQTGGQKGVQKNPAVRRKRMSQIPFQQR